MSNGDKSSNPQVMFCEVHPTKMAVTTLAAVWLVFLIGRFLLLISLFLQGSAIIILGV